MFSILNSIVCALHKENTMSWDSSMGLVKEKLPKFNDYLLRGYRQDQVNSFPDTMAVVFTEAAKLFNGKLVYKNYKLLAPEDVVSRVIENGLNKGNVNIQRSELQLYEYDFEFEGHIIPVHLYLPYMYQDALIVGDTRYYLQLPIIERTIYRITEGVIIKVMRLPP